MFIVLLGVVLWTMVSRSGQANKEQDLSYSEFMAYVDKGNVKDVTLYLSPNSYEAQGRLAHPSGQRRAACPAGGLLGLHDAPDAGRRKQGAELRQIPRAPADRAAEESHLQRRGWH